tara:strand:- start:156 stop:449 length:294 start_codon:yes stop_codon:yes gene_type:complete
MAQRGISLSMVKEVIEEGEVIIQKNRTVFYMSKDRSIGPLSHLRGLTVVMSTRDYYVISVFRTEDRRKLRMQGKSGKKRDKLSKRDLRYWRRLNLSS